MNVPKLRFKEFTDEWKENKLHDIAKITMGQSPNSENYTYDSSDTLLIQGNADLYNGKVIPRLFTKQITKTCDKKDIIMTVRAPVGDIAISDYYACIGRGVCSIKSSKFIYHYLDYLKEKGYWKKISKGSTIDSITSDNIKSLVIKTPSRKEQEKIIRTIDLINKKIELQTRKIEALKLFKKGLINYLFSQNTIMKITVKDLGTIITGTTPSKENNFFWHNGNIPWITPSDITYERDISNSMVKLTEEGLLNGRYLPKNSILVTCIASIGKNAVLKVNGSCNQQINAIIPNEKFNHNYIYYLMEYMSNYMKSIAGTSATSIINKNDFEKLNINVHSTAEQIKIDKILSSIEAKEKLEVEYLNNITKLKTYLLQNMFI